MPSVEEQKPSFYNCFNANERFNDSVSLNKGKYPNLHRKTLLIALNVRVKM